MFLFHLKSPFRSQDIPIFVKKSTLFFLPNPVPFNVQSYQKQKGPGASDHSLFRL